jgi:hypothetical protein
MTMNRHQRRKLSRHAKPEEILPGGHGPIVNEIRDRMIAVMDVLRKGFPGCDITLFISERNAPAGENRDPRFNYISTADRRDMLAVLEAFVAKHRAEGAKLDAIADEPPTGSKQ